MINRRVASLFACVALVAPVALVACGGDKPTADTPPTAAVATTATPAAKGGAAGAAAAAASTAAKDAALGGAGGGPTGPGGLKGRPATVTGVHIDPALITQCKIDADSTYFEYDPPTLKGPDLTALNLLSACVTKGPLKGKPVEVVGYEGTEAKGSRAQAVADYLEAKDVKKDKLKVVPKGDDKTIAKVGKTATEPALTPDKRVTVRLGK